MRPLGTLDSDFPPYHQGKFLFFSTTPRRALTVTGTSGAATGRAPRSRAACRARKIRAALFAVEPWRCVSCAIGTDHGAAQAGRDSCAPDMRPHDLRFEIKFPPCRGSISIGRKRHDVSGPRQPDVEVGPPAAE